MGLVSCSKDGSIGPQGPMGEKGEQGISGKNGATVLNGNTDPTAEQGSVGDFYINTSTYVLFGPKSSSGWGNGESILGAKGDKGDKGEQGEKGEADYVILSGTLNPVNNTPAKEGDFYLNRTTKTLFYRGPLTPGSPWIEVAKLANTLQFTKTVVSLGDATTFIGFELPYDVFEKSMVHVYVKLVTGTTVWAPLPGYVGGGASYFRTNFHRKNDGDTNLAITRQLGSNTYPNASIRIVVTEAHEFHTLSKYVDFNNYRELSQYIGLKH